MKIENRNEGGANYFCAIHKGKEIGEANYFITPGKLTITHVGVDPEYRGMGYARELVMAVVEYARKEGLKVVPLCSYSRVIFERDCNLEDVLHK